MIMVKVSTNLKGHGVERDGHSLGGLRLGLGLGLGLGLANLSSVSESR